MDDEDSRKEVRYISAPTRSGKTASVLPAFLQSTSMVGRSTYYFYLAFDNNNKRNFKCQPYIPSADPLVALKQGAAFMVECVKALFEHPDVFERYTIKLVESPTLEVEDCSAIIGNYLTDMLGENSRICFHLDEHSKMCDRQDLVGKGADFSRGAMSALASVNGLKVIATYIERPSIHVDGSSGVCRVPVALPTIDVNKAMAVVPELTMDSSKFNFDQKRMFATLKFRLGFQLRELGFIPVLHFRGSKVKAEAFLLDFAKKRENADTNTALKDCISLCAYVPKMESINMPHTDAIRLLCGMMDHYSDFIHQQLADVVSLPEGRITVSVPRLLEMRHPEIDVYATGRDLFDRLLSSSGFVSGSPLEAAYYWTLSCHSAISHSLNFEHLESYLIKCNCLMPSRLFLGSDSSNYDLSFLKPNIMYYADERVGGRTAHPIADLFFITRDDKLVLIGIYGGNKRAAVWEKKDKLVNWIAREQSRIPKKKENDVELPNIPKYKLEGIVLAPHTKVKSYKVNNVLVVAGEHALKLLGGLQQVAQWLE